MIVLTDRRIVRALLDGKGAVYSDRPDSYVLQELITGGNHLLVMKYGSKWRRMRKLFRQEFQESRSDERHLPVVEAEGCQMVRDFLLRPEDMMVHPKRYTNSILMSQGKLMTGHAQKGNELMTCVVYGIRTPTAEAPHMRDLYAMIENWAEV